MSKINKKSIYLSLGILAILVFAGLAPLPAAARENAYVTGYSTPPVYNEYDYGSGPETEANKPAPVIKSINPSSANAGSEARTITITGSGFTPSSVVKVNGFNRSTTFIDGAHLLAQVSANDLRHTDGGFYLTVWNSDGRYSNAAFFTLKGQVPVASSNDNSNYSYSDNYNADYQNAVNENSRSNGQSLASSVILGGNSFLPNGLVQWVLVAILILLIIIIVRKVLGAREHYDNTPLKHA